MEKVLTRKEIGEQYAQSSNSKESVTTPVHINTVGKAMPTFCIVKGKTMRSVQSFSMHDAPENKGWTYQTNAWMCNVLKVQRFRQGISRML